jgi:uncharacterized alpha-E superfamily protein
VALLRRADILPAAEREPSDLELVSALRAAITDDSRPGLASGLRELARVASHLRERLSLDNWRTINRMTHALGKRAKPAALSEVLVELDHTIAGFTTLSGFALDGMTRDPGWRFLSIGRRLERLQWLCATLKRTVAGPAEMDLTWLLRFADSIITYRARYMARPEWLPVLDLLILDEANPRSVAFQLMGLNDIAQRLFELFGDFGDERFEDALNALLNIDPGADLQPGSERLMALFDEWQAAAHRHGEELSLRFFSHAGEANTQTFAT